MSHRVFLESDTYGSESFKYDTSTDQIKGVNRLFRSVINQFRKDGISRRIIIEVDDGNQA